MKTSPVGLIRRMQWVTVWAALALVVIAGVACSSEAVNSGVVRGFVVEVADRSITEVETLRIRDDTGRLWTFTTEGNLGKSGSHLRLHGVNGESVLVAWTEKDGRLVATQFRD